MKRILFYAVLLIQVGIISILGIQYYLIDNYGTTIKLLHETQEPARYQNDFQNNINLNYEINTIPDGIWEGTDTVERNDKVHVLLDFGTNGIYHAVEASDEKLKASSSHQIVITGQYQHYNSMSGQHRVNYGIEEFSKNSDISGLEPTGKWVVILKVAPWNQMKVVDINVEN